MLSGFITAFRTLTIVPVPGKDSERLSSSLPWFPIVGLLLGGVLYGIALVPNLLHVAVWTEGIAAAIVVCSVILTRAMHLDGLADCADGFGCRGDRAKVLAVMKDPHTGAFGTIAIVVALLVRFVAVTKLVASGLPVVILAAAVVSRTMQVELATVLPYARREGGTAAPFVNGSGWLHRLAALGIGLLILVGLCGPVAGGAVFTVGWSVCRLFGLWCRKKINGVTGDCLGACSEMVEMVVLFAGAAGADYVQMWFGWCG